MRNIFYIFIFLLFIINIYAKTNDNLFITDFEYGEMLYENPRGIGCVKCHGEDGNKKFIAKYKLKNEIIKLYAPKINNLMLQDFKKVLTTERSSKSIMPTYFLTSDEIQSIYLYITDKTK
jgi:mono/diheme cytochrome c family protein